ncbi:MAG: hypothetical protein HDR44_02980 [Allobaculum sp.]|nr:hypothetical protein [Allobaculum sp.]
MRKRCFSLDFRLELFGLTTFDLVEVETCFGTCLRDREALGVFFGPAFDLGVLLRFGLDGEEYFLEVEPLKEDPFALEDVFDIFFELAMRHSFLKRGLNFLVLS